jgi:hypothetical protein
VDVLGLGTVDALFNRRHRCLHDYVFASEVIVEEGGALNLRVLLDRLTRYAEEQIAALEERKKTLTAIAALWFFLSKIAGTLQRIISGLARLGTGSPAPKSDPSVTKVLARKLAAGVTAVTTAVTAVVIVHVPPLKRAAEGLFKPRYILGTPPTPPRPPAPTPSALTTSAYAMTVLADHPTSYWRLDDSSLPTARDQTGHNDGSIRGNVGLSGTKGPVLGGGFMTFAGGDAEIDLGHASSLMSPNNWSVEAWFKTSAADAAKCALSFGGDYCYIWRAHPFGAILGLFVNGRVAGVTYSNGATSYSANSIPGVSFADSKWHHAVFARDMSSVALYMDGALQESKPVAESSTYYCCELAVAIANDGACSCSPYVGGLAEVAYYSYGLSYRQVQAHYAAAGQA